MVKIDKHQYTKEEWHKIRDQRRLEKAIKRGEKPNPTKYNQYPTVSRATHQAFVLGNGTSRSDIPPDTLIPYGKIYGCNALYRHFVPDYLVAVDVKMVLEINKAKFQHKHQVYTNPNKAYHSMKELNFFNPSKGWSSGPTALWLASQHGYERIYILGFDYKGLNEGKKFNNIYADTPNYKKSLDGATFYGNWLRQTKQVIKENPNINYIRVKLAENYEPDELNTFTNYSSITIEDLKKQLNLPKN